MRTIIMAAFVAWATLSGGLAEAQQASEPEATANAFGDAAKVAGAELAKSTGSANLAMAITANNSSNVANNSVVGQSTTGQISFDQASLSNLSGLSVLSANTGNNVSINSSLNLNVAIRP